MSKHKDETKKPIVRRTDEELEAALLAKVEQIRARKHAKDRKIVADGIERVTKIDAQIKALSDKRAKVEAGVSEAQARIDAG